MADQHTPRSAVVLLSDALGNLDLVEPPTAREPIRSMFRAAIEECVGCRSLLGKRVNFVLQLAEALTQAAATRGDPP